MQRWVWAVGVFASLNGCGLRGSNAPATRHNERVAEINRTYDDRQAEVRRDCAEQLAQVETLKEHLVRVLPQGYYVPQSPVAPRFDREVALCHQLPNPELQCMAPIRTRYFQELGRTYFKADLESVFELWDGERHVDLEALLAHSHNGQLLAYIDESAADLVTFCKQLQDRWEELREAELAHSAEQQSAEEEEQRRRTALAIAAGLQAFGEGLQGHTQGQAAPSVSGCTSDFACGPGQMCVKQNYSTRGVCMRKVGPHGAPDYSPANPSSVGVKLPRSTDCKVPADCPVGFSCQRSSGACVR